MVDADFIELIYMTSPLHDIGKVGIPDEILLKAGPLTAGEFNIMKQHSDHGEHDAGFRDLRVSGSQVPLHGPRHRPQPPRALRRRRAIRTGWQARRFRCPAGSSPWPTSTTPLTTRHVYSPAFSHEKAHQIICEGTGTQFDPDVVDAYLANEERFIEIYNHYAAREPARPACCGRWSISRCARERR